MKTIKLTLQPKTLFVVVTTYNDGERELYPDIILITPSERRARNLTFKLKDRAPVRGLDYSLLSEFTGASYFSRDLNSISCWNAYHDPVKILINKRKRGVPHNA